MRTLFLLLIMLITMSAAQAQSMDLAKALVQAGKYGAAQKEAEKVLQRDPDNSQAKRIIAQCREYRAAQKRNGATAGAALDEGEPHQQAKQQVQQTRPKPNTETPKTTPAAKKPANENRNNNANAPRNAKAKEGTQSCDLAMALVQAGKYGAARKEAEEVLKQDPKNSLAKLIIAQCREHVSELDSEFNITLEEAASRGSDAVIELMNTDDVKNNQRHYNRAKERLGELLQEESASKKERLQLSAPKAPKPNETNQQKAVPTIVEQKDESSIPEPEIGKNLPPQPPVSEPEPEVKIEENKVYDVVEQQPAFNGYINQWLASNLKYPPVAAENGIEGRVIVQFVVGKDGSIHSAQVVRGVDSALDREALRVVYSMPKWVPAKISGQSVNCKFTLPVVFRLQ